MASTCYRYCSFKVPAETGLYPGLKSSLALSQPPETVLGPRGKRKVLVAAAFFSFDLHLPNLLRALYLGFPIY